jgi:Txe/YoeB family toxin of Txe-Axe toxin-antitoxin module
MILPCKIRFADEKIKKAFEELEHSITEDRQVYNSLNLAFKNIGENAFCGIQIPKRLIPKEYLQKYGIDNCWKYGLPKGWRLLYSVARQEALVVSIILEWGKHKRYDRKFGYKTK